MGRVRAADGRQLPGLSGRFLAGHGLGRVCTRRRRAVRNRRSGRGHGCSGDNLSAAGFLGSSRSGRGSRGVSYRGVSYRGVSYRGVSYRGGRFRGDGFLGTGRDDGLGHGPVRVGGPDPAGLRAARGQLRVGPPGGYRPAAAALDEPRTRCRPRRRGRRPHTCSAAGRGSARRSPPAATLRRCGTRSSPSRRARTGQERRSAGDGRARSAPGPAVHPRSARTGTSAGSRRTPCSRPGRSASGMFRPHGRLVGPPNSSLLK